MRDNKCFFSNYIEPIFVTPETHSHWFGYYNYSPLNVEGNKLLAHRVEFDGRAIQADDTAKIGYFDLTDGTWNELATTNAINWQQGSMLQWITHYGRQDIIYNDKDVENNKFVSKCINLTDNSVRVYDRAVYGITKDNTSSITLEFKRSYWCRAYHYESIADKDWSADVVKDDGIFRLDLKTGKWKRIIAIDDVIQLDYHNSFAISKHWLAHIMLNPSGTRFAFYHRFDDGTGFKTRVLTADLNGNNMFIFPGWENNSWSHLGWKSDSCFVLFGRKRSPLGKTYQKVVKNTGLVGNLLRSFYRRVFVKLMSKKVHHKLAVNSCYQIYLDKTGLIGCYAQNQLINDGHPSFTKNGEFMLTDTYQDNNLYRHLILFNTETLETISLGKFYSPFNNCGHRCDLHPRFSFDENFVIIDTAHSGKHQMMVLKINWDEIHSLISKD